MASSSHSPSVRASTGIETCRRHVGARSGGAVATIESELRRPSTRRRHCPHSYRSSGYSSGAPESRGSSVSARSVRAAIEPPSRRPSVGSIPIACDSPPRPSSSSPTRDAGPGPTVSRPRSRRPAGRTTVMRSPPGWPRNCRASFGRPPGSWRMPTSPRTARRRRSLAPGGVATSCAIGRPFRPGSGEAL